MILECQKVFEENIKKYGDKFLFDNLMLQDGSYVLVSMKGKDFSYEVVDVKYDKKKDEIVTNDALKIPEITRLNYYSELVDIQKPVDGKKVIHSNGIYSFFVKKDSISSGKLKKEIIENYYDILADPLENKYKKDKKKSELFTNINEKINARYNDREDYNKKNIDRIKSWILENIDKIEDVDYSKKDYLKIFFVDEDREEYKELNFELESRKYQAPNIYNKNDFNEEVDGKIYGLSNNNMGMNAKKPFLEHKNRKLKVSNLVDDETIFTEKKFFDYLYGIASAGKNYIFFDTDSNKIIALKDGEFPNSALNGYFMYVRKGKEPEILNFDVISNYKDELKREFDSRKLIDTSYKAENDIKYGKINKKSELFMLLDSVIFRKYLRYNMFTPASELKIQNSNIKSLVLNCREIVYQWIYKDNISGLSKFLKYLGEGIKNNIYMNYMTVAKDQFNIYISLKDYMENKKEGEFEKMQDVREVFRNHLNVKDDWNFADDREYYFAMGQTLYYLMNLSKSKNKDMSYVKYVLNSKNDKNIKNMIKRTYSRYSYAIKPFHTKINKTVANIMGYESKGTIDTDMLFCGMLQDNEFYRKNDVEEGK